MVVYIKDSKGKLKTFQDIALEYKVPVKLVYGRYQQGYRNIEELVQPKFYMYDKEQTK